MFPHLLTPQVPGQSIWHILRDHYTRFHAGGMHEPDDSSFTHDMTILNVAEFNNTGAALLHELADHCQHSSGQTDTEMGEELLGDGRGAALLRSITPRVFAIKTTERAASTWPERWPQLREQIVAFPDLPSLELRQSRFTGKMKPCVTAAELLAAGDAAVARVATV